MSVTVIDLVSASIESGEYRLDITVTMGVVELFLPSPSNIPWREVL